MTLRSWPENLGKREKMSGLGRKFALIAQVAILVFAGAQSAWSLEKVRVLIPVRGIDEAFAPFVVAKEKGYFEAEGYDVSLLAVGGSNESAIQVSAGNAEIGAASPGKLWSGSSRVSSRSVIFTTCIMPTSGRSRCCRTARSKHWPI